jgi:hypothetical protein
MDVLLGHPVWVAVRRRHFLEGTILSATRPEGWTSKSKSMDRLSARIRQKCPHYPTPPLLHPRPAIARCGRSSSTNQSGAQSPCMPHIESRRPLYAGLPRELGAEARGRNIIEVSRGTGAMAYRIATHRTSQRTPRILPQVRGTQDPLAHGKPRARS